MISKYIPARVSALTLCTIVARVIRINCCIRIWYRVMARLHIMNFLAMFAIWFHCSVGFITYAAAIIRVVRIRKIVGISLKMQSNNLMDSLQMWAIAMFWGIRTLVYAAVVVGIIDIWNSCLLYRWFYQWTHFVNCSTTVKIVVWSWTACTIAGLAIPIWIIPVRRHFRVHGIPEFQIDFVIRS